MQPLGGLASALTERFEIRSTLGAGGMGIVYEAFDRERSALVALKALRNMSPASLYRFKREFRALADLTHRNLVALHELFSTGEEWFFTMELVRGTSLLDHLRPEQLSDTAVDRTAPTALDHEAEDVPPARPSRAPPPCGPVLREHLLSVLEQLTSGLGALHAAGRLHRDIKPSNVLVTPDGRVVICDFGLVTESIGEATEGSSDHVVGTAPYMSPEQAAGLPLTEASDWYSVGVIVYQALTGELPFSGTSRRVLLDKQLCEPPPPSARATGVPPDLDRLCSELLRTSPERRAGAREVLALLGRAPEPSRPTRRAPFVGRRAALDELGDAFRVAAGGTPITACVEGSSGMGKTTLVRQFLDQLAAREEALVLRGRSYERESVPYKALDNLVDALSNHLRRLPRREAEALVPPDVHALVRLFPVLRRVDAVAEAPPRGFDVPDPQESRRRASTALRELIARLSSRRPVVLHLDDLQWGDVDSAPLLVDLIRGPPGPRALLVMSYRSEDADTSPLLRKLLRRDASSGLPGEVRRIALDALSHDEARRLALSLIERSARDEAALGAQADTIARESGGSPMFVYELVRHLEAGEPAGTRAALSLDQVVAARVEQLPDAARALLTVVAVAGRPLSHAVATHAAAIETGEHAAVSLLCAERLLRSRRVRRRVELEVFHDRIREAVTARLDDDAQRRCHRRLLLALERVGEADPEALVDHLLGAGERVRAGAQAELAADHAASALAFDRAARLYRLALELRALEPSTASSLWTKLGDALVNGGRGADAAAAYEKALEGANTAASLELKRRMAEQLLRSGHLDEGLRAVRDVLGAVGMKLAATPEGALASLVIGRARIRLRGLRFKERDASELAPAELTRIDACWSIATAVGMTDFIRGADFQTRHLLLALRAGEPHRVARGLAVETAYSGGAGGPSRRRTRELARATQELAARLRSPELDGLAVTVTGIAAFLQGRWRDAREACNRGETIFRERCRGVAWELASAEFFGLGALYYLGFVGELSERVPERLREAEERGDLYRATGLRSWRTNIAWLVRNAPASARQQVEEASRRWSRRGFHLQHFYEIHSLCQIDLYEGHPRRALERIERNLPRIARSMMLRIQNTRVEVAYLRARCALAAGLSEGVEADAERLEKEHMPWSDPYARALRAACAWQRGELDAAARELERAAAAFDAAHMALFAAAARRRLGALLAGERGAELVAAADRWMRGQRIDDPARMAAMLVAGFGEA